MSGRSAPVGRSSRQRFVLLLALAAPGMRPATAQVEEAWVARYDGPGESFAFALAVDANGNVYVTGASGRWPELDFATVKYDREGNELWVTGYNGSPGRGPYDSSKAVAVDDAGNVYITGISGAFCGEEFGCWGGVFATVKYDPQGNELWVALYGDGGGHRHADLALDPAGNVYVVGTSGRDFATVKYDAQGNQVWVARYQGEGVSASTFATALALDAEGNVCVTGSAGAGFVTIK